MSRKRTDYNSIDWGFHFRLDPSSPSGLVWNREVRCGKNNNVLFRQEGTAAGSIAIKGNGEPLAWQTNVNKVPYLVHRILWCLLHGSIDDNLVIDHIDGNPLNNNLSNLRLVSQKVNSRNKGMHRSNKYGFTGVCRRQNRTGFAWKAVWVNNGKQYSKSYSVKEYGEDAFRLACEHRTSQIALLNNEGQGYSDRHGN